jgi:tRNA_anti-like
VQCPRCAAEISPLRDFCPRCGAAIDAGLRDGQFRRDERRSPDELSRNRKTVLGIAGAVLVLAVTMGNFHPFGRHVSVFPGGIHIDTASGHRQPMTIGAADFFEAYHTDSRAAERRFRNREMIVTGEFVRTVPDGYGSIDMRLKTNHPDILLGIDLDSHSVDAATKLEPGQTVTVSCRRVAGFGDDPWLQDCVIQPPAPAATTTAPSPPPPPPPAAAAPARPSSPHPPQSAM